MSLQRSIGFALALTTVSAGGCKQAEPTTVEQDHTERGSITILVTVDWEGRDLLESNLSAMENLRERFPDLKLVHFLNAAYFTKPDASATDVTKKINRAVLPGDERGLHIHGWKELFEASGVAFRNEPTFWDEHGTVTNCTFDCGHEVPISAYEVAELQKVIRFSVDTLDDNGFGRAVSFRAGGWMADAKVREALVLEGFITENSAVPSDFLESEIGELPLHGWVEDLWRGTTSISQPHEIDTESGWLIEVPDNGALADYMTGPEMVSVYEDNKEEWLANTRSEIIVSIGFHQETAAKFTPRVAEALDKILEDAKANDIPVKFATIEELLGG